MDKQIIFLLDDDESVRKLYRRRFENSLPEVDIYTFENYEDLKEHPLLKKASLFIYDILLGDNKTGDQVALEVTKINPAPVLFISGADFNYELFNGNDFTHDFIVKPPDLGIMINRVKVLLKVSKTYECFRNEQDQLKLSLREVFNHSNLYLLILDRDMVVKSCSTKLMEDLGYDDVCDIEGKPWFNFIKSENKEHILHLHKQVFADTEIRKKGLKESVTSILTKDDKEIVVKWFYSIIKNGDVHSFNIGMPRRSSISPDDSLESIREYWREAIILDKKVLKDIAIKMGRK